MGKGKCPKVKNPCKICLEAVTQKNGLQCCGACENWVHYGCLNYTPGRIQDIKAGIIRVTCPCPDCRTSQPKEYRTDEPFSCTNLQCPANRPPQCGSNVCPATSKMMQTSGPNMVAAPECPLGKCGKKDCKMHSSPLLGGGSMHARPQPCNPNASVPKMSTSDACLDNGRCPTGCQPIFSGDTPSVGSGFDKSNELKVMEQVCNTVGLLSQQINELMQKMQAKGAGGNPCKSCAHKTPTTICPKPCYCPDNPKR